MMLSNIYSSGILASLLIEKQKKYSDFLPNREKTIKEISSCFEKHSKKYNDDFNHWEKTKSSDILKEIYTSIMKNRLNINFSYIRRHVLYIYVIEKLKQEYDEEDLTWIEQELFSICMYQNFENLYLTFMIWRIKTLLENLRKNNKQDIRIYVNENWFEIISEYNQIKKKFLKLKSLYNHYTDEQFNWFKAEMYVLDVIFKTDMNLTDMEKFLLAYQLYRSYHTVTYHIKCGDTFYKLLYFISDNLETEHLIHVYNMILVCYNKCVYEGYKETNKNEMNFSFFTGIPRLNLNFYERTVQKLYNLTKSEEVNECYTKFLTSFHQD